MSEPTIAPGSKFLNVTSYGDTVRCYYRDAQGERRFLSTRAEYAAFLRRSDFTPEVERALRGIPSNVLKGWSFQDSWVRLVFANYDVRRSACTNRNAWFQQSGIPTFEGDVGPSRRLVADKGLEIARPRRVYLDIETDSRIPFSRKEEMRILSWATVDEDGREVLRILPEDTDAAEKELLEALWSELQAYDQVDAWNGERFDFPVIIKRSKDHGIKFDEREFLWLDHLVVYKRLNAATSGDEKISLKLENVCQSKLGEGKLDFNAKFTYQKWAAGGADREELGRYNLHDTRLLRKLEAKTGFLSLFQSLAEACRVMPDSVGLNPMVQVDGFMLRLGIEHDLHFPTRMRSDSDEEEREKFRGAFVMEPKRKGILKGIHVCDFAAMYPSIIRSWNMSPETKIGLYEGPIENRPEGTCYAPGTAILFDTKRDGILPMALSKLADLRAHWTKLQASLPPGTPEWFAAGNMSTAYKVASNSFYGVVGSPTSRYFDREIAESVTQNGAWLIKRTMAAAEEAGMDGIYGDTDSDFIGDTTREHFTEFTKWCNEEFYPYLLEQHGCTKNYIKIAYEKEFARLVFVAAKKYAGRYAHYKGKEATKDSKPEVKGLEWKRGDSIKLARDFQYECIDAIIMKDADDPALLIPIVQAWRGRVLEGELTPEEVQISKSIKKDLDGYTRTKNDGTPFADLPQVQVAKVLQERGEDVGEGTRVDYFIAGVKPMKAYPIEDWDNFVRCKACDLVYESSSPICPTCASKQRTIPCDRFYMWESLVFPPTMRLLEAAFPEFDWTPYLKARPAKVRRRKGDNPNQERLFAGFDAPATRVAAVNVMQATTRVSSPKEERVAVPGMRRSPNAPIKLLLEEAVHDAKAIEALNRILLAYPGRRPVDLSILSNGKRIEMGTPHSVKVGPELLAEFKRMRIEVA